MVKYRWVLGSVALFLCGSSAFAQETTFRGFRVEAKAGVDRLQANGNHDDRFAYGGAAGWDGIIGEKIVVGPEVSYLDTNGKSCAGGVRGGQVCTRTRREIGIAVRAGYLPTPALLIFGKAGYANDSQRKTFTGDPAGGTAFNDRYRTDGYQVGGGIEYSLVHNFYVSAEYKYANYYSHTSRQNVLGGIGVRF
ncbi:outer membrane protein [Sphingomonas faeni]|uniref:outer membrane protein n=1 Tax=Sphingomonas faeni TaxID=185950 RepID=UPI0033547D50